MYYEVRKDFTGSDAFSLRELLVEAEVPITYRTATIRARSFGGTGLLKVFREGIPVDNGTDLPNVMSTTSNSAEPFTFNIRPGDDPAWLDSVLIGRPSGNTGTQTLVMTIE